MVAIGSITSHKYMTQFHRHEYIIFLHFIKELVEKFKIN